MSESIFLTLDEVAELTGIRRARLGKTCGERQAAQLRKMRIPHHINAAGRPVVARSCIEVDAAAITRQPQAREWVPAVTAPGLRLAHG